MSSAPENDHSTSLQYKLNDNITLKLSITTNQISKRIIVRGY